MIRRVTTTSATIPVYIYGLCDRQTGEVRYVGRSTDPRVRLCQHMSPTFANGLVKEWIARNGTPAIAILDTVNPGENPDTREKLWISRFPEDRLLNIRGFPWPQRRRELVAEAHESAYDLLNEALGPTSWARPCDSSPRGVSAEQCEVSGG